MEVPFHSSGAISRAHYAIVRKVETAPSVQTADQHIFLEIKAIEGQLMHPRLSPEKCKECLVILLYCSTAVTPGFLPHDALDFAFSHAINLAAAGGKIEEKRIGYLFCSEIIPMGHELRLMLVNTLRKDLESDYVPHVCLALDNLIASPNEDVIPAVQSRLHELLSHDYPHVKRRALFAFGALSVFGPALLESIQSVILRRLKDRDDSVVNAALTLLSETSTQEEPFGSKAKSKVNELLVNESSFISDTNSGVIVQALKALRIMGVSDSNIPILLDILKDHAQPKAKKALSKAIVLDVFKILSQLDLSALAASEKSSKLSIVQAIRHWLSTQNANENYLFISCLECVDVGIWAGIQVEHPAVLDADEFERIMLLLNSSDRGIFKKTARIVNKVDPAILDMQISLTLDAAVGEKVNEIAISRALDMLSIRHSNDGEKYASSVVELAQKAEVMSAKPHVLRSVVKEVLTVIRASPKAFGSGAAAQLGQTVANPTVVLGSTALVIATALTTEYSNTAAISSAEVLSGLAERLKICPAIVQEPCLIAMLRVSVNCETIPNEIIAVVTDVSRTARSLVQARCAQFLEFTQKKDKLLEIVDRAASSSLPDFLLSLQQETGEEPLLRSSASSPQSYHSVSRSSLASSNLKYAPYAPPQVGPRLKGRRRSSSRQSVSSRTASQMGSPPLSAGQLALTTGLEEIHIHDKERFVSPALEPQGTVIDLQAPRTDLITLDSPFHTEPLVNIEHSENTENTEDFSTVWHALEGGICDSRGWCKHSIDTITRRLQQFDARHRLRVIAADVPPFEGELKIVMVSQSEQKDIGSPSSNFVALRLRESDEDSCLWRLRCADATVGRAVQRLLDDDE
ncbi:armadillo-type protein [Crepidotus variabilis]|uniref:Armadillo-type protein n=1 Tax=Crepidotus variabilis TaxID=179855 RepID=A0A9P6EGI8_9AGAR|nr:armadillo-type protein [Crepidotus variabilis]